MSSITLHLGLDVHKDSITIAEPGEIRSAIVGNKDGVMEGWTLGAIDAPAGSLKTEIRDWGAPGHQARERNGKTARIGSANTSLRG